MVFDIASSIVVLVFALVMQKRGGMRAVLSLSSLILSVIVASMVYPALTDVIYKTALPENLEEIIHENILPDSTATIPESFDALPDVIKNAIGANSGALVENVVSGVTRLVISAIIFVLVIVITKIIIALLAGALDLVVKLPLLKELNALVGLICGGAAGLVVVWIGVMLVVSIAPSNVYAADLIKDSYAVEIMSNIYLF